MEALTKLAERILNMPQLGSRHGAEYDGFFADMHISMTLMFVIWSALLVFILWRFHANRQPHANPRGAKMIFFYSFLGVVLLDEMVTLFGMGIPLWNKTMGGFPPEDKATVIRVTAQQFTWNVRYPGKDGEFGAQDIKFVSDDNPLGYDPKDEAGKDDSVPPLKDIRVPLEPIDEDGDGKQDVDSTGQPLFKPVLIHLTSLDVIHSFKLFPMRVTQDVIPGMSIPIHFMPTQTGKYMLTCAQLCGNGHATMVGWVTVMDNEPQRAADGTISGPGAYDQWLASHIVDKSKAAGSAE